MKKFIILTLLILAVPFLIAAVTLTNSGTSTYGWIFNAVSDDITGCEVIKAKPGAGANLILDSITINSRYNAAVVIGEGETSSAVTTVLFGPVWMTSGDTATFVFPKGLRLNANSAMTADVTTGDGAVTIVGQGITK